MLDRQVLDKRQRNLELVREEAANDEKRIAEESQKRADQDAYGRKVLHSKYGFSNRLITVDEIGKDGDDDILMDDAAQTGEERDANSVDLECDRATTDAGGEESVTAPVPPTRVCLPAAHPFFSQATTKEDAAVLLGAMTTTPVRAIADEFERVALNWFRDSLQLVGHLRWLRKLMLMSEGLCMDIFARDFLRGLSSSARVNWGVDDRLTSALTLAMIEGSVTSHAIVQSFHYKTTDSLSQAVPSLLSEIALVYEVQWPLGLVITVQSRDLYTDVHRFLLYVRLTTLEMREVWGMLRTIGRHGQLPSALQRSCGDAIYKMQSFLGAFIETFSTKVSVSLFAC
ncbi:hypothetical protein BBJ28_00006264 [Nothophytophthora sp. Chile5]|nr:hypothetical protein BBJ28_00006264 [Nothophytophthora sp. Chile5]